MIEIEYIVKDKQGVERLRTADKKQADAYDKALDVADALAQWLRDEQVLPNLPDTDLEELTIHLARHARTVERILKGKEAAPAPTARKKPASSANDAVAAPERSELASGA
ncbi:YebG family protein [Rhabdochromatium marinum]|uniref:YebG family protein n=1 Tax=Rhabdochromatium marinum TaxID=48729 RepID=UPI001903375F|nr:hypothetical protein [Rhabdochromatium marinum]